jgi:hypothetical protein
MSNYQTGSSASPPYGSNDDRPVEEVPAGINNPEDIGKIQNEPNDSSPSMTHSESNNSGKFVRFVVAILVLVALSLAGYFGYSKIVKRYLPPAGENNSSLTPPVVEGDSSSPTPYSQDEAVVAPSGGGDKGGKDVEVIDFQNCSPGDGYLRTATGSSTYLSVVEVDNSAGVCKLVILNEVKDGYVNYSCDVPKSVGVVEFAIGSSGSDFSKILDYCTLLE